MIGNGNDDNSDGRDSGQHLFIKLHVKMRILYTAPCPLYHVPSTSTEPTTQISSLGDTLHILLLQARTQRILPKILLYIQTLAQYIHTD